MRAALDKLDPGSRALLDLSVKRGMADDEIAQVLRAEPEEVAERRESILARIADDLGSNGPDLVSRVKVALRDLPPEGLTASAEGNGHAAEDEPAEEVDGEVVPEEPAAPRVDDAGPVVEGEVLEELAADEDAPSAEVADPEVEEPPVEEPPVEEPPVEEPPVEEPPVQADPIEREPVTESSGPRGRGIPRAAALAGLAAVAVIVLVVVLVSGGDESSDGERGGSKPAQPQQPRAEGTPLEAISGKGSATASIEGRGRGARLTLTASGLGAAGHEAWLYDSLSDAVSIGRLKGGRLTARLPADPAKYRYLDVSVEPRDGNPNHSGQSVLRVPTPRFIRGR